MVDQVHVDIAPPTTVATVTDSRVTASVTDDGTNVTVVSEPKPVTVDEGLSVTVSSAAGGGGGGGTVDAGGIWGVVQDTSAEFRADTIETALTHAQRSAIGTAWPDGNVGMVTVAGTIYGYAPDGSTGDPVRVTYNLATGAFTSPTACTIDPGGSGQTYLAGGATLHDGSRYVQFAHGEPGFTGHLLTSTDGLAWTWVGLFNPDGETQCCFVHPSDGWLYLYVGLSSGNTTVCRVDYTDLFAWAAGGSVPTVYRWTGSAWSSTPGSGVELAGPSLLLPPVADCCYVAQIDRVLAVAHHDGAGPYELDGYVIDPDTPYKLTGYSSLYRDPADRFVDPGSNIGYVFLAAPDRVLDSDSDHVNLYRVDALDPGPGQPWDDTIVTRVQLRPAVDRRDDVSSTFQLDGLLVSDTLDDMSVFELPAYRTVNLTGVAGDYLIFVGTESMWARYEVSSAGDYIRHPEQPTIGDHIIAPSTIAGTAYRFHWTVEGFVNVEGVRITNTAWSQTQADIASNVFIFNSSGGQSGKRYNSWAQLQQVCAVNEGSKTIIFEQNEHIPAGTYDFDGQTWLGNGVANGSDSGGLSVFFGDQATSAQVTISSWVNGGIGFGLRLVNECPAAVWPITGSMRFTAGDAGVLEAKRAPIYEVDPPAFALAIFVLEGAQIRRVPVGNISGWAWSAGEVTVTFSGGGHNLFSDYVGSLVTIAGATGWTTNDPNGVRTITAIPDGSTLRFALGDPGSPVGGTATFGNPVVAFGAGAGTAFCAVVSGSGVGTQGIHPNTFTGGTGSHFVAPFTQGVAGNFGGPGQLGTTFNAASQPAFTGTFAPVGRQVYGHELNYTPANPAIWTDPDPDDVNEAIDRIAAALAPLLGGGVIP